MSETKKDPAEVEREKQAELQNLPSGAVPERRPQATQEVAPSTEGEITRRLREAGDPMAPDAPAMPQEAYDKAASDAQAKKAAKESRTVALRPGARAVIDNPDSPHHGRMVAVNRVTEWASTEDERLHAAGTPESRFAQATEYECRSRDGRHDLLLVSGEHLKQINDISNYNKNPT